MSRATPAQGPEVPRSPTAGTESATLPAVSAHAHQGGVPREDAARAPAAQDRAPAELRSGVRRTPSFREFVLGPTERHGQVLGGRYRIEGFLARGGTADVFLARDFVEESLVVIKQIRPDAAAHPELRARFVKEGYATRAILHPGVVRVLSVEEPEEDAPFIILEALRGESLGDYLRRRDKVPVELGLVLVRQAAAALAAVHASGVVHRDVKPDNLFLVGPADEPSSLKLLDFGMADFGDERAPEDSTSVLGTAQYMAPEQILVEPVDARADVYGLGVVMFRMFSGHLPFEGKSPKELLLHQLFSPVPPPSWLVEDLDPRLEELILRATKKHRDNRFSSMDEMIDALDALVGLRADSANPPPCIQPDVYRPQTARGQRVARHLAVEFGPYAAVPPSTRFA